MMKSLYKSVVIIGLLAALAGQSLGQPPAIREQWDTLMRSFGFAAIDAAEVPPGLQPALVSNLDEVRNLDRMIRNQAQARAVSSLEQASSMINGAAAGINYQEVAETKVCDTAIGLSTYSGYADVTIGIWNGVYRAYQSIDSNWWSHTGVTLGIIISDVQQNNYLASDAPASAIWMKNNFTINWYVVTPLGWFYLYSEASYVHCHLSA